MRLILPRWTSVLTSVDLDVEQRLDRVLIWILFASRRDLEHDLVLVLASAAGLLRQAIGRLMTLLGLS